MKIVISGYYGFANTGDEAIALAITRELKKQGHTPILLSNTPQQSAALYGCQSAARMKPAEVLRALSGADMLLSGGGGLLQDKTSSRTLAYYLGIIRLGKMLRRRVVIFNQSIGPLSASGEKQVSAALRGLKVIVRDRGSLDTLRRLNIPGELGGDPALLLEPSAELVRNPHAVVIAPRGDVTAALPALRETTARLREQGRHVIALSLMPEQDDEAARSLDADQLVSTHDPQAALDVIASSGYVVGVRLHALILAAAANVPFAGISYDPKVAGFCRDAGAPIHEVQPEVLTLTSQVYERRTPDWSGIEDMKFRALQSFVSLNRP